MEHWAKKYKRSKQQKDAVKLSLASHISTQLNFPVRIKLTRIAPRQLDSHDNLISAFKAITDAVADFIFPGLPPGRADDSDLLEWVYEQKKGNVRQYAIEISITPIKEDKDLNRLA